MVSGFLISPEDQLRILSGLAMEIICYILAHDVRSFWVRLRLKTVSPAIVIVNRLMDSLRFP